MIKFETFATGCLVSLLAWGGLSIVNIGNTVASNTVRIDQQYVNSDKLDTLVGATNEIRINVNHMKGDVSDLKETQNYLALQDAKLAHKLNCGFSIPMTDSDKLKDCIDRFEPSLHFQR